MQGEFMRLRGRLRENAIGIVSFVLLLFPSSPSVLCMGPGDQAAVEDLASACCAGSAGALRGESRPHSGLAAAGDCQNCTDEFLTPNGRGANLSPRSDFAPNSLFHATPGAHIAPDSLSSAQPSATQGKITPYASIPSFLPLLR